MTKPYLAAAPLLLIALVCLTSPLPVHAQIMGGGPMMPTRPMNQPPTLQDYKTAASGSTVYLIWTVETPGHGTALYFERSTDGGKTFGSSTTLANGSRISGPEIAASGNMVHVAWSEQDGKPSMLVASSADGGATFGSPVTIGTGDAIQAGIGPLLASGNYVSLVWTGMFGPNRTQSVMLSQSTDGGATFADPEHVSDPSLQSWSPFGAQAGQDAYVVWSSGTNCQNSFGYCSPNIFLRHMGAGSLGPAVHLAPLDGLVPVEISASQGNLVVEGLKRAYDNAVFENSTIVIMQSTDGGSTFSTATSTYGTNMAQIFPVVAGPTLYQFWTAYENGLQPQPIYVERSTDGGKTFDMPEEVSAGTTALGTELDSSAAPYGNSAYVAWYGTGRDGSFHEYLGGATQGSLIPPRTVEDAYQAGRFHLVGGPQLFLSLQAGQNILAFQANKTGLSEASTLCPLVQPGQGGVTLDTPQVMVDGQPTKSILAGWDTELSAGMHTVHDMTVKALYQVEAVSGGKVVFQSSANVTATCGYSPRAVIDWAPQEPGNYTIISSLLDPENRSGVISTENTTLQVAQNNYLGNFSSSSPVQFRLVNESSIVNSGGWAKFAVDAGPSSPNYRLHNISLWIDAPPGMTAWFDKYSIYSYDYKLERLAMYVYAGSAAPPGNAPLVIEGKGVVTNLLNGTIFNIGNPIQPAGPRQQFPGLILSEHENGQQVGTITVSVNSTGVPDSHATVGTPTMHPVSLCSREPLVNGNGGGGTCIGFIGYEEFPLTVYSATSRTVSLGVSGLPDGAYARFLPQQVDATPGGTPATMVLAGAIEPFEINVLSVKTARIYANSTGGSSVSFIPITKSESINIVNGSAPLEFGSPTININHTTPNPYGMVYDSPSGILPVSLSVLGVSQNGTTGSMPPWLAVNFVPSQFTLNATQPFYMKVETVTRAPPEGANATVLVGEKIGGRTFTGHLFFHVPPAVYFSSGMRLAPVETHPGIQGGPGPAAMSGGPGHLECGRGLVQVTKAEDGSHACVRPQTAQALVERGWAKGPIANTPT